MTTRTIQRHIKSAMPATAFASRLAARGLISAAALLPASGCAVSTSPGAPDWIPLAAATNEQAETSAEANRTTKSAPVKTPPKSLSAPHEYSSASTSTHAVAQWKTTPESFAPLSYFEANCARCHGPNGSFYGASFGKTRDDAGLRLIVHDMAFGPAQAPIDDAKLEVLTAYHRSLIDKKPFLSLSSVTSGWASIVTPQSSKKSEGKPAIKRKTQKAVTQKRGATPQTAPSKAASTKAAPAAKPKSTAEEAFFAPSRGSWDKTRPSPGTGRRLPSTPILILKGEATPGARVTLTQGGRTVEAQRVGDTWKADLPIASLAIKVKITAKKDDLETVLRPGQNAFSHSTTQAKSAGSESSSTNDSKADAAKK